MKPATINRRAFDLFQLGKIKARVKELRDKRAERTERTADEVINLLWEMTEYSLEDYFNISKDGEITAKRFDQLKPGAAKLINGIKFKKQALKYSEVNDGFLDISDIEYKMPNKDKMIELLMKHHGLFEKDNNQGISEVMLAVIIGALPAKDAENVKKALIVFAKGKK